MPSDTNVTIVCKKCEWELETSKDADTVALCWECGSYDLAYLDHAE